MLCAAVFAGVAAVQHVLRPLLVPSRDVPMNTAAKQGMTYLSINPYDARKWLEACARTELYRTGMVWAKDKIGTGYYVRNQHEHLLMQRQYELVPAYTKGLVTLSGTELLQKEFPPREMILGPWLPQKASAMIFAERGIGKTWIALNIAHAVSGGGPFLRWRAPSPRRVVYIDGEMPAAVLKDRYAAIVAPADFDAPEGYFKLVAADLQQDGLLDLANPDAQRFYDEAIKDAELIIVDNLSTVCRAVRENEADSWGCARYSRLIAAADRLRCRPRCQVRAAFSGGMDRETLRNWGKGRKQRTNFKIVENLC